MVCALVQGVERQTLVTCGLDKLLRVYDVAQRNFVAEVEVGGAGIACLMTEASYFLVMNPFRPVNSIKVIFQRI